MLAAVGNFRWQLDDLKNAPHASSLLIVHGEENRGLFSAHEVDVDDAFLAAKNDTIWIREVPDECDLVLLIVIER